MFKTTPLQRAAVLRYSQSPKGRIAIRLYRESPEGRATTKAARLRYLATPKGQAAQARARLKARERYAEDKAAREAAFNRSDKNRDLRRRRIMLGLPPELPARADGRRGFTEEATAERLRPEYIAAALAIEDLV